MYLFYKNARIFNLQNLHTVTVNLLATTITLNNPLPAYRTAILLLISYFYGHSTPEQHGRYNIRPDMFSMSYVSHADSSMMAYEVKFANDLDIYLHHVIYYM
jgi:hypothetical protein